ncbi:MAG TPA: L,D-transpeptidase family protein [Gammaproteobacteria bacterium]|nr:L,D-transpeptidase family protein [Gammaproteobacteria bacterium]
MNAARRIFARPAAAPAQRPTGAPALPALILVLLSLACTLPAAADRAVAPDPAPLPMADEVVVYKAERRLELLSRGEVFKSFPIALGARPEGHKEREGDQRTPEGRYVLDWRNPDSAYFLSLRVSYPNAADLRRASELGVSPGNNIMIHGLPNEPEHPARRYLQSDWTDGCIAVSNSAMIDIWLAVADGTPIHIRP